LSGRAGPPRITLAGGTFRAAPWSGAEPAAGWGEVFAVFAGDDPAAPAMLGAYAREGDAVAFTPRFAPAPGLRLRAVFSPPGADVVTARFGGVPVPPRAPTTRVLSVTPSAEIWPENILKLYITFSAPMRIGVALDNIRIRDANGAVLGGLFVEIDRELWDTEGRRLTVLFDPGRIKRGLVDNINEGPPLVAGERTLRQAHPGRSAAARAHRSGGLAADSAGAADGPADRRFRPAARRRPGAQGDHRAQGRGDPGLRGRTGTR
jgi:hypothetical protein